MYECHKFTYYSLIIIIMPFFEYILSSTFTARTWIILKRDVSTLICDNGYRCAMYIYRKMPLKNRLAVINKHKRGTHLNSGQGALPPGNVK